MQEKLDLEEIPLKTLRMMTFVATFNDCMRVTLNELYNRALSAFDPSQRLPLGLSRKERNRRALAMYVCRLKDKEAMERFEDNGQSVIDCIDLHERCVSQMYHRSLGMRHLEEHVGVIPIEIVQKLTRIPMKELKAQWKFMMNLRGRVIFANEKVSVEDVIQLLSLFEMKKTTKNWHSIRVKFQRLAYSLDTSYPLVTSHQVWKTLKTVSIFLDDEPPEGDCRILLPHLHKVTWEPLCWRPSPGVILDRHGLRMEDTNNDCMDVIKRVKDKAHADSLEEIHAMDFGFVWGFI